MSLMRFNRRIAPLGCAFIVLCCGCSTPLGKPVARSEPPRKPAMLHEENVEYYVPNSSEPDMAAVLDKLQQVRAIDAAAEQKLLEELRRTPSKSWPMVAEKFRASLAYHEQLASKKLTTSNDDVVYQDPMVMQTGYDGVEAAPPHPIANSTDARPSAPIGRLVDPRRADSDGVSSEAMASRAPYSSPGAIPQTGQDEAGDSKAPADFVPAESVSPIAGSKKLQKPEVVPVRLESAEAQSAAQPATSSAAAESDWQELVKRAADDLSKRVGDSPATTAEIHQHASLRMLWLLAGDTEKALEPIPHISPAEQDYWSRQMFSLATYLDHHSQPDDKRRAAAGVIQLDEALSSLRAMSSLSLRNLTFCENVYGYGSIEPFKKDEFAPGQQVALYVEVENYHSKSTEKGYCTSLGSTYEILDEQGERVGGDEFPDVDDCCRSRRRDFHIQYSLAMPEKLAPGRYRLELVVKDRQSDKIGHATVSFEIRGSRSGDTLSAKQP